MSRYQVLIEDGFSSAHALRHYHGKTEPLHGHNYRVQVIVEGKRLQKKVKYVTDFIALQKALGEVVRPLDHINLNETPPFNKENPSAENLAQFIHDELKRNLPAGRQGGLEPGVRLVSVTVWETPETAARYLP